MAVRELVGIEARMKGHSIVLTAQDADGEESTVTVPCEDIQEVYGISCPRWMDKYGDNEAMLWELYNSVAGIQQQ